MRRREQSNQRFRQGFLAEFAVQVRAFAEQLRTDSEAPAGVAFELGRLAAQAETLTLTELARIANDASRELAGEALGLGALRRVATAIRQARGALRIGPIVVVGGTADERQRMEAEAELSAEPVLGFADLASFASDLHPERPEAVVLPVSARDAIAQVVRREGCVVLAHGDLSDSEAVREALAAGAGGFVPSPLGLAAVTRQVRWRGRRRVEPATVVFATATDATDLVSALAQVDPGPVPVRAEVCPDLASLARALTESRPAAIAMAVEVAGVPAAEVARFVRAHPQGPRLVVLMGPGPVPPGTVAVPDGDPEMVAAHVLAGTDPVAEGPVAWDRSTGLRTRLGVLDALDLALRRHSRHDHPLTVALVDVAGLAEALATHGPGVAGTARHHVSSLLSRVLRKGDAVGELGAGQWLVVLEHCLRADAEARLTEVIAGYEALGEPGLTPTRLIAGFADTSRGARSLAPRAEADLAARLSVGAA